MSKLVKKTFVPLKYINSEQNVNSRRSETVIDYEGLESFYWNEDAFLLDLFSRCCLLLIMGGFKFLN